MSSSSREVSRDRDGERTPKHQHSFSENGRAPVPMWDSSDPERAPPPLPLNPSSPGVTTTRPNTSATVAAAAAALTEKARESASPSTYTTNPMSSKRDGSPEKSLIRGHHHKRMQSLQASTGTVKDMSLYLDSAVRSPDRSPERSLARSIKSPEAFERTPERSPTRSSTPTTFSRDSTREPPTMRPSARQPPKSILGDHTPPQSATMLALQTMPTPSSSEKTHTAASSSALTRTPQSFDALSTQILSLTSIATNLQREMAQLSRRSKDNATDLISLKEATNSRDEDIRKSLRDLVSNLSSGIMATSKDSPSKPFTYSSPGATSGAFLLDNKPHASPPGAKGGKAFTLPRIPSPTSFAASLERELNNSPNPYSIDGAANLALLEKILREMGTKEGQEGLVRSLTELLEKTDKGRVEISKKLEELVECVKDSSNSRALVTQRGPATENNVFQMDQDHSGALTRANKDLVRQNKSGSPVPSVVRSHDGRKPFPVAGSTDLVGDDMQKLLRRLKDSVTETGGMTAEVKALVRELRGEVLGMGREIGRKLETVGQSRDQDSSRGSAREKAEMAKIVHDGLKELREHMDEIVREKRRQSSSSAISRNTVDSQEVYEAVRAAVSDLQLQRQANDQDSRPVLEKEDILEAVREAWETYKPEIELQNFGLERDEILQCLREGLAEHGSMRDNLESGAATRDDVFEAIKEGLDNFKPPAPVVLETEASITRGEILAAVRESLETFDFPVFGPPPSKENEITRDDVVEAVREGLGTFDFPATRPAPDLERDLTREDVVEAVRAGFEGAAGPMGGVEEQVLQRLQEVIEGMRVEFSTVSEEAKQNVAASGRDTEQVLDAVKDGLEHLRSDIELYVDRAADVTGKDEIIESLRDGFHSLRDDIEVLVQKRPEGSESGEMMDTIKEEFEHLRSILATTLVKSGSLADKDEIIDVMREGFDEMKMNVVKTNDRPESILSSTGEILDALNDGLDSLRSDIGKVAGKPVDMTVSYEILDTLRDGLAGIRADIDHLRAEKGTDRDLGAEGGEMVVAEGLKRNDIENLEVLITQLRIKVEALEVMSRDPPLGPQSVPEDVLRKEDLCVVEDLLNNVRDEVAQMAAKEREEDENTVRKEDIDAIETLLINTKAKIDDMVLPNAESSAKQEHVEAVEFMVRETKDALEDLAANMATEGVKKDDMSFLETLLKEISLGIEEIKERAAAEEGDGERVTKTDLEAIEVLCLDTKTQIEQIVLPDPETLPTKADIKSVASILRDYSERAEHYHGISLEACEDRRAEHDSLAEKLGEVKGFLQALKGDLRSKLDDSSESIMALGKLMEGLEETIGANSTVSADIKEVMDVVNRGFERSHGLGDDMKLDAVTQSAEMMQKLDERFDELMTKYDDAQVSAEAKLKANEEKDVRMEGALTDTRAIAEDLKLLIDTLGTTVTESTEKMGVESKTVFIRVDETQRMLEETHAEEKAEHQHTRDEVQKAHATLERVQEDMLEYHPKLLTSIKHVLTVVSQHYEQAREMSKDKTPITDAQNTAPLQSMISDVAEKFNDAEVHSKLDKILDHSAAASRSLAQVDLLGQIHQQVMNTSAEVSDFVTGQAKLLTEDYESKEKQAQETAIVLERRLAQKEQLEMEIASLKLQKEQLVGSVDALKAETEDLGVGKTRLIADVASLKTALRIRHEELVNMEARAEGLERRILSGVIDNSRTLLVPRPKDPGMRSLKRVSSQTSATSNVTASTLTNSGMNKNKPRGLGGRLNPVSPASPGRRILSLNQISGNASSGRRDFSGGSLAPTEKGLGNLKRSQSVRTGSSVGFTGTDRSRKSSYNARDRLGSELSDKENSTVQEETASEGEESDTMEGGTSVSASTDRRGSYSTDRRASYGTVAGTVGGTESVIEEDEDEADGEHEVDEEYVEMQQQQQQQQQQQGKDKGQVVVYDGAADSALGADVPTADLNGGENVVWAK